MANTIAHVCVSSGRTVILDVDEVANIVLKALRVKPEIEDNIHQAIETARKERGNSDNKPVGSADGFTG